MRGQAPNTLLIDGGEYEIGAGESGFAYDNERPRHTVELEPFEIDTRARDERRLDRLHG